MTKPKKKKGSISAHLIFDLEDDELDMYIEDGRKPLPPFIKPRTTEDAKKKRRPS